MSNTRTVYFQLTAVFLLPHTLLTVQYVAAKYNCKCESKKVQLAAHKYILTNLHVLYMLKMVH
jgi:hypothetical protein